jgi:hypothetical protein
MNSSMPIAEKPPYSKIKLTKKLSSLSVYIPPIGFHSSLPLIMGFAAFWNSFLVVWTSMAARAPFPGNLAAIAFSIPFWGVGLFLVFALLFCFYGQTYLHIDNQVVDYVKTLFGRRVSRQKPILRRDIQRLTFIPKHFYRDSDGDRIEKPAELLIGEGSRRVRLGGVRGGIEHDAEVSWLAAEISDWLDISLETIIHNHN